MSVYEDAGAGSVQEAKRSSLALTIKVVHFDLTFA